MMKVLCFEKPEYIAGNNDDVVFTDDLMRLQDVDAIYMENAKLTELLNLREYIQDNSSLPIFVITSPYREALLHSILPNVEVISDEYDETEIIERMLRGQRSRKRENAVFTPKEKLMLTELAYGTCNKEMCKRLNISDRTVRRYKTKLLEKTGLLSSEQLGLYALLYSEVL